LSTTSEILRGLPYFADVSDDILAIVSDTSEELTIPDGTVIIEEGASSEEMYVVVSGELLVTKLVAGRVVELARIGAGEVFGEIALLDQAPRNASVTTQGTTRLIRVPVEAFEQLLNDSRVVRRMFRTVTARLRSIEDTLRHEERMAALGRMAAQLMHELNNPAAAVARTADELTRLQSELSVETTALGKAFGQDTPRPERDQTKTMSSLERADAEDSLAAALAGFGVSDAWELSPSMVDAGWDPEFLAAALEGVDPVVLPHLARWLALEATNDQLISELGIGARRIAELVRVVKEYSFVDRAPIQEIDVTIGIQDTLILLKHKLRGIEVDLDFAADLSHVEAPGRDLNQVWTNLIDNAADAMEGSGTLMVSARNDGSHIVVSIADTGPGIPDDVAPRIFDPFFTTKEPGKGTGLGMHTVHTIINRIGGDITLTTGPGGTTFDVRLPAIATPAS
jgi:signal transduction histidine kinase